ncbi:MAG: hypothetical protein M4579_000025 [Chaenotheca gracillima]|nr:MAG: hypothetical protein M4579_000025 [Chaenotheca gracillima]
MFARKANAPRDAPPKAEPVSIAAVEVSSTSSSSGDSDHEPHTNGSNIQPNGQQASQIVKEAVYKTPISHAPQKPTPTGEQPVLQVEPICALPPGPKFELPGTRAKEIPKGPELLTGFSCGLRPSEKFEIKPRTLRPAVLKKDLPETVVCSLPAFQPTEILKETVTVVVVESQKVLGSRSDDITSGVSTLESFLELIAVERLRSMPHQGSKWDKVLRLAGSFASNVDVYSHAISTGVQHAHESARIVWSCCRLLLELGPDAVTILEKVFVVFHQMERTLNFFLRHEDLFFASAAIQHILACAYVDLLQLCTEITFACAVSSKSEVVHIQMEVMNTILTNLNLPEDRQVIFLTEFDARFGNRLDSFYHHKDEFSSQIWVASLDRSSESHDYKVSIRTIRSWLASQDRILDIYLSDRTGSRTNRQEFTCEWFAAPLRRFLRSSENLLLVSGQAGTGKSMLAGFVLEFLTTRRSRKIDQETLSFTIDANVVRQRNSLSVVKGLLLQLLDGSVGDAALLKLLSTVYDRAETQNQADGLETALWKAFEAAITNLPRSTVVVIDGLDQLDGGEPAALRLCDRLRGVASSRSSIKCILLSRPISTKLPSYVGSFTIGANENLHDVRCFVEQTVNYSSAFVNLKSEERQQIIERVLQGSSNVFSWADLTLQLLKREKTFTGIIRALEKSPKHSSELIGSLCSGIDFKQADTKLIFSWLLVAERPLTLKELKALLEVDVKTCGQVSRFSSIEDDIRSSCGSLVDVRDGIVRFSHVSIKEHLLALANAGKIGINVKDAHREAATRSLAYITVCLGQSDDEPSFDLKLGSTRSKSLEEALAKHQFLEYSVRYYLTHFRRSGLYESTTKFTCPKEIVACFPKSSFLAMVEASWWEAQTSAQEAEEMHALALALRKAAFGKSHQSVIQGCINLGSCRQKISSHVTARDSFYEAWVISKSLCGETSSVTLSSAKVYIDIVTTHTTISVKEVHSHTEEIYKYVWTTHKHIHGETHEETLKYAEVLATFYITLQKTEFAATVYREIYNAHVKVHGHVHAHTIALSKKLVAVLEKLSKHEECLFIYEAQLKVTQTTLEVWHTERITATLRVLEIYESKKQIKKAEEVLMLLHRSLLEACHSHHEEHVHEARIEVSLQYVRFLKRCHRDEEAKKILVELWGAYEKPIHGRDCHGDGLLIKIRIIGEEMQKLKIVTAATGVFTKLWRWYKGSDKGSSEEATSVAISLSHCHHHNEETHCQEEILREVFETTITETVVKVTTITTCLELSSFYEREKRWADASQVCLQLLVKLWPGIGARKQGACALPHGHHDEGIKLAQRLAICYLRLGRIEEAEGIHVHVYRACKASLILDDEVIIHTAKLLVGFYEEVGMIEKALTIWRELRCELHEVLGTRHTISIEVSYHLAHLCERHSPHDAGKIYIEIISTHEHGSGACEKSSVGAVLALCIILEREKKWKELQRHYHSLWVSFRNHGKDCGMDLDTIVDIYAKYLVVLQSQCNHTEIVEFVGEFRDACKRHYGDHHHFTIKVTVEFAGLLEKDEKRHKEAMAIYEEICRISSETHEHTTIIQTTITVVKERLAHLYTCHHETVKKAETIYIGNWDVCVHKHGHAHEDSLARLAVLIAFFRSRNTKECKHTATLTLEKTIIEIITKEKDAHKLFHAAQAIARLYLSLECRETASELLVEIRRQLTENTKSDKFGFHLHNDHTVDRRSFVFVLTFEATLTGKESFSLFAEIMNDLMTETTFYESWMRTLQYGGKLETRLSVGVRLLVFLEAKDRTYEYNKIKGEIWTLFLKETGGSSNKTGVIWDLFNTCVARMGKGEHDLTVIQIATTAVLSYYDQRNFQGSFELATWLNKFIETRGGFSIVEHIPLGFDLALCLSGRTSRQRCNNHDQGEKMMKLSSTILTQVLRGSEKTHTDFSKMSMVTLNLIVSMLGDQKNYLDLERILRSLWNARLTTLSWDSYTIVWIGRRLCEVQFAHGHYTEAIALCEDMCYNLRRVYGPLDRVTIDCFNLLSSFHTASGHPEKAIAVHEEIMQQTLADDNSDCDDDVDASDLSEILLGQVELLKKAHHRHGKWEKDDKHYIDLVRDCKHQCSSDGHNDKWNEIETNVKIWNSSKETAPPAKQSAGHWEAPNDWGFLHSESKQNGIQVDADEDGSLSPSSHMHMHMDIGSPNTKSSAKPTTTRRISAKYLY